MKERCPVWFWFILALYYISPYVIGALCLWAGCKIIKNAFR